jgi:hypothetical protein
MGVIPYSRREGVCLSGTATGMGMREFRLITRPRRPIPQACVHLSSGQRCMDGSRADFYVMPQPTYAEMQAPAYALMTSDDTYSHATRHRLQPRTIHNHALIHFSASKHLAFESAFLKCSCRSVHSLITRTWAQLRYFLWDLRQAWAGAQGSLLTEVLSHTVSQVVMIPTNRMRARHRHRHGSPTYSAASWLGIVEDP